MRKLPGILCALGISLSVSAQTQATEFNDIISAESAKSAAEKAEAQEKPADDHDKKPEINQNLIVTKINFQGLKKTKDSYIQSKVKKFTGRPLAETDLHALETAVQLEELFDDIHISPSQIDAYNAEIIVSVKEKITFIPLPFALVSSSGFMAGAVVMDTNAFGRKDNFLIGGFFSNSSKTGMASFSKQPKEHGIPGLALFVSGAQNNPELVNLDEDTVLKYKANSFSANLALIEKIGEHFSIANAYGFKYLSTKDDKKFPARAPESIKAGITSLNIGYSKSDWNGVFMSTNSIAVSGEIGLTNMDEKDFRHPFGLSFAIGAQHPIFIERLRIYQKMSGFYGKRNHIAFFKGQGEGSVNILPGSFVTERIVGGNAGLEIAVAKFSWATISIYGDYQLVYTKDMDKDYELMHGPNGGVRFYLSKIAFPALAIGVAYNATKHYFQAAAAMGVSF